MNLFRWGLLVMCAGLFACGGPADDLASEDEYDDSGYADDSYADDEEEGVFDPMVGTIDRAKGVEDITMDRKRQIDEALDQ